MSLADLAKLAADKGEFLQAQRLLVECLELERRIGRIQHVAVLYSILGDVERRQGRYGSAQAYLTEALQLTAPTSDTLDKLEVLYYAAELLADTTEKTEAVELLGFIATRAEHSGLPLAAADWFEALASRLKDALPETYEQALERGRALTIDVIVARFADKPMD